MKDGIQKPFGRAACESELKVLSKSEYEELYFDETPFNDAAISPQTYLIVGRRGSGKTALAQYFSFQKIIRNPVYVDVDEPALYQQVLSDVASRTSESREIAIPRLKKIWEYVLWCVIFQHTRQHSGIIAEACDKSCPHEHPSGLISALLGRLLTLLHEPTGKVLDQRVDKLLNDERLDAARREALKFAAVRPIIIAFDTLEKYDVSNEPLMNAMAALVQCAAEFNLNFSDRGIHLKAFMSGEVFPYLEEEALQNPLKSIEDPVYLLWRPKDLLRLICWRLHRCLESHNLLRDQSKGWIDWKNHREVFDKMWTPYFGQEITNVRGMKEQTFPYILRHTQMRPRQLIVLCNSIAENALRAGRFPRFFEADIRAGIKTVETKLAIEIINSFSSLYPQVSTIVDALMKIPMLFTGNELDKRASQSASDWPQGTYSQAKFRRLVAELGIVGLVRRHNEAAGYIDADFEYSLPTRLTITHRDKCVIHPMFYSRFNVDFNSPSRVIPFSTERGQYDENGDFS